MGQRRVLFREESLEQWFLTKEARLPRGASINFQGAQDLTRYITWEVFEP